VTLQGRRHGLGLLVPEPGRPLDVSEEQRHGAARQGRGGLRRECPSGIEIQRQNLAQDGKLDFLESGRGP